MLVLSRKANESVEIQLANGTRVTIMLVDVTSSRAKLGITAPKGVNVVRTEVYNASANRADN